MKAESHLFPSRNTAGRVFHTGGAAGQHGVKQKLWHPQYLNPRASQISGL